MHCFDAGVARGVHLTGTPVPADPGVIDVVVTRLDVEPRVLRAAAAVLHDAEHARARRFAFEHDRRRFMVARARLRQLLGARLGIPPQSVDLVYGGRGKPALGPALAESGLRFNLAHAAGVAAYALACGRDVGIDIEPVRRLPDADAIARQMFSARERAAYFALPPRERPRGFFNCWTRKEAFIKALGDGLSYPLDGFEVSFAPGEPARLLRVHGAPGTERGWALHSFSPGPGFTGAVVAERGVGPARIVVQRLSDREPNVF